MVNIPLFIGCQPSQIGGYRISQPPTETGSFLLAKGEHDDQPVRKYGEKSPILSHTTVELDFLVIASLIWRDLQRQVEDSQHIEWANPMTKAHQPRSISPVYHSMCPHYFHSHSHFCSVTFQFLLPQADWKIDQSWFVSGRWISGRLGPIRSHLQIIPDPRFSMVYFRSECKMDENWGPMTQETSIYQYIPIISQLYPNYIP